MGLAKWLTFQAAQWSFIFTFKRKFKDLKKRRDLRIKLTKLEPDIAQERLVALEVRRKSLASGFIIDKLLVK